MLQDSNAQKSTGLVTLLMAGTAMMCFISYRACDRVRNPGERYADQGGASTTRPSGSSVLHRPWYSSGGGASTPDSTTTRGGFGSRSSAVS